MQSLSYRQCRVCGLRPEGGLLDTSRASAMVVHLVTLLGPLISAVDWTAPAEAALCSRVVGMHQQVVHDQAVLHPPRLHQWRPRGAVEHLPKGLDRLLRMRVQHQQACRSQQAT